MESRTDRQKKIMICVFFGNKQTDSGRQKKRAKISEEEKETGLYSGGGEGSNCSNNGITFVSLEGT